jgi:hypothetical protein
MADVTPIPVNARPQKDVVVVIDGVAYQRHVSNINFTPQGGGAVSWRGGTPDSQLTDSTQPTGWLANITAIQAWDDPDSLVHLMLAHAGEKVDVAYRPHRDSDVTFYATIDLMPPTIGGPTNAYNEATIGCPSTAPSTVAPTVPAP